jgi:hypothetical protein
MRRVNFDEKSNKKGPKAWQAFTEADSDWLML